MSKMNGIEKIDGLKASFNLGKNHVPTLSS